MIIQYASDLHLEFSQNKAFLEANPLQPKGEVLLLAGDIVPFAVMHKHDDFFKYLSDNFENTYWIPGNHEYYKFDAATKCGTIHEKIKSNVFLVNDISVKQANIRFIFSTLWSKIRPAYEWHIEHGMSDFELIKFNGFRFSSLQFNQLHQNSMTFLANELSIDSTEKTVVVTHHVPTFMNYPEKYKGDVLNDAFAIELSSFIEEKTPDFWLYAHTHHNTPVFSIGKTQLITNQLGYVKFGEHEMFNAAKTILL